MYRRRNPSEFVPYLTISTSIDGWTYTGASAVGGSTHFGFIEKTECVTCLSDNGFSIFDCSSGERLDRRHYPSVVDARSLQIEIPFSGSIHSVRLASTFEGGLPRTTEDGWTLAVLLDLWPRTEWLAIPPNGALGFVNDSCPDERVFRLNSDLHNERVFGFSWTGKSLILADRTDIHMWHREQIG